MRSLFEFLIDSHIKVYEGYNNDKQMRNLYLSHQRAAKAQASLRFSAESPEPLLLVYTKYGCS